MIAAYLKFLYKSKNEHSIHSPFVFELYTKIILKKEKREEFLVIENLRKDQLENDQVIEIQDFGAGSKLNKGNFRRISEIAKNAEKSPKFGQLLFRLIEYFQPKTVLDLGTSLGISTLYQEAALTEKAKIYSFEGCPQTANEASKLFDKATNNTIEQIVGNLDQTLKTQLAQLQTVDFVFFDANHRYEPTIRYFTLCLEKATEQSVFVFDDIHWSAEMEQAWLQIKQDSRVMITIDLFWVGLVFFRTNQPKQDFVLRF
ncbi:MAG: class I SAM-dependent methyltransferase [Bacteroidota bacterium]